MNAILERIKEAYHLETDAEVADFLEIKPSTLSMQKNRGRLDLKRIIEKCSDLNKNWLLEGEGKKRLTNGIPQGVPIPVYKSFDVKNSELNFDNSSKVGKIYTDFSSDLEKFRLSKKIFGYLTQGNDMAPVVKKNDIAIIDREQKPQNHSIFLLSTPQKVILRRLVKKEGTYITKSENGNHKSISIGNNDKYQCVGKLTFVLRNV